MHKKLFFEIQISVYALRVKFQQYKKHQNFTSEMISHLDILHHSYLFLSECLPNRFFFNASHFLGETVIFRMI